MLVSNESNFLIFSCIVFLFWGYEFQPFRAATNSCQNCEFFGASKTPSPLPRLENGGECFNSASQRQRWHGVSGCRKPRNGAFPGWWTPRPGPRMEKRGATSREPHRGLWSPFEFGRFPRKFSIPFKRGELPGDDILFLQIHSVRVFFKFAMMNKNIVLYKEFFSSRMWLPFVHVNLWFWRTFVAAHMGSELPTTDHWGVYWRAAGRLDISGLDILI